MAPVCPSLQAALGQVLRLSEKDTGLDFSPHLTPEQPAQLFVATIRNNTEPRPLTDWFYCPDHVRKNLNCLSTLKK